MFAFLEKIFFKKRIAKRKEIQDAILAKYPIGSRRETLFLCGVNNLALMKKDVDFLKGVIDGTVRRNVIRRGLCFSLGNSMSNSTFLDGFKYWSGQLGHVIRLTELEGDESTQYYNERKSRYNETQIGYYRARQELAKHWLNILEPIYKDVCSYKNA